MLVRHQVSVQSSNINSDDTLSYMFTSFVHTLLVLDTFRCDKARKSQVDQQEGRLKLIFRCFLLICDLLFKHTGFSRCVGSSCQPNPSKGARSKTWKHRKWNSTWLALIFERLAFNTILKSQLKSLELL